MVVCDVSFLLSPSMRGICDRSLTICIMFAAVPSVTTHAIASHLHIMPLSVHTYATTLHGIPFSSRLIPSTLALASEPILNTPSLSQNEYPGSASRQAPPATLIGSLPS